MEAKTGILTRGNLWFSFVIPANISLVGSFVLGSLKVQEYIEAATFFRFCRTGTLLHLDEINATLRPLSDPSLEPLQINVLDYLLGVIVLNLNSTGNICCLSRT